MMPNAALMQHIDARQYDLLIISEPLRKSYQQGVPFLGDSVTQVCEWIARQSFIKDYRQTRTIGSSAGGYAAVICGYRLGSDMAVSVGGRFPSERHFMKILKMSITLYQARKTGKCANVIMSFDANKTRDRNYARIMSWLSRCRSFAIQFSDEKVGHKILQRLIERGELSAYFSHTILSEQPSPASGAAKNVTLILPENKVVS